MLSIRPRSQVVSLLFAAMAGLAAMPASAQAVLTVSSWVPPTHMLAETVRDWCAQLEQKAAGKVRCNILPRAVSGPPGAFDAVKNGLADVSYTVHGYTPNRFITTQMGEMPFLGDSAEVSSIALQRIYQATPAMVDEHKGVRVLTLFTHGPGIIFNTKHPVTKLDDLAGLKMRVGGGIVNEVAKQLGMNTTLKPSSESYELLSTGVMDGTLFPAESVSAFKIDKIIRYGTTFPGGLYNTSFVFMMNPAAYDRLPPEGKKAVDELSGEAMARTFGRAWDKADRQGLAYMQASGVAFVKADAAFVNAVKARLASLEDGWAKAAEGRGLKDPKKSLAELRAEIAKLSR